MLNYPNSLKTIHSFHIMDFFSDLSWEIFLSYKAVEVLDIMVQLFERCSSSFLTLIHSELLFGLSPKTANNEIKIQVLNIFLRNGIGYNTFKPLSLTKTMKTWEFETEALRDI